MKKETTISVKATLSKPKVSEKKASAKKAAKADDVCADTPTEVTNQQNELPPCHADDMVTNQSATSDCLIATKPTAQIISGFPVDVLPAKLQEIVNEANVTLGIPKDYIAGSMLTAMAAVIGNTHSAEAMAGWKEYAILFVALVGCPGVCKSHPLSYLMQPLIDHDAEKAAQFAEALKRYNAAMELTPKERVANGYELNPAEPRRVRFMMQDVTNEAVHRILSENPRGLILMYDELAGWVKNFNRYNKGSDEEYWLKLFNANPSFSDRKGVKNSVYISRPFISVVGTIQNGILNELAQGSRTSNGFIDRLLFVMPGNQDKQPWSDREPSFDIEAVWADIIGRLVAMPYETDDDSNIVAGILPFSPEAKSRLYEWQRQNTEECNREECDALKGVYNKFDFHAIRFCLIMQMARWACGEADKSEIDLVSVENAISLVDYFKTTATRVQGIIRELSLSELQRAVMSALPDEFTTEQGVEIAAENSMPERTFKDFIRRFTGIHFQKIRHGIYGKI